MIVTKTTEKNIYLQNNSSTPDIFKTYDKDHIYYSMKVCMNQTESHSTLDIYCPTGYVVFGTKIMHKLLLCLIKTHNVGFSTFASEKKQQRKHHQSLEIWEGFPQEPVQHMMSCQHGCSQCQ